MQNKVQIEEIDSFEFFSKMKATIKEAVEEYLVEKGLSHPNSEFGEYCTIREACQYLKVSKPTFQKLLKRASRLGVIMEIKWLGPRSVRYRTSELSNLMELNEKKNEKNERNENF